MEAKDSKLRALSSRGLKVAIVHDWMVGGGAEQVVWQLHQLFPKAPIYTSYCSEQWHKKLAPAKIITGYLQHWPFSRLRKYVPLLRIMWFSKLDLSSYDLVISSSGAEAKGVRVGPKRRSWLSRLFVAQGGNEDRKGGVQESTLTADRSSQHSDTDKSSGGVGGYGVEQVTASRKPMHVCYCHAPTHYYWERYEQYLAHPGFGFFDPLARFGLKLLIGPLRWWDKKAAQRPDHMLANSNYTKDQINKYYGRDSTVIHPPVDTERFSIPNYHQSPISQSRHGFVVAGRQTPYKRFDLAIEATGQLNAPLLVIGRGPDHKKLIKLAGRNVTFLTRVSDEELPRRFAEAEGFIFPGIDDFGIVAVEAMAAGTPVIAYKGGGALDYVIPGKSGLFFESQTPASLVETLRRFNPSKFNNEEIAKHAQTFSEKQFIQNIKRYLQSVKIRI